MLSVGATCLVDKSGEEGVSVFVISGELSPAKPENTGFFPVTGGLGISTSQLAIARQPAAGDWCIFRSAK
jgi:hypothetical protein